MTLFLAGSAALVFLAALAWAVIYSGQIPFLCSLTGAAQPEPEPYTYVTETDLTWLRGDFATRAADVATAALRARLDAADAAADLLDTRTPHPRKEA